MAWLEGRGLVLGAPEMQLLDLGSVGAGRGRACLGELAAPKRLL